jgi:hypothetical protein
VARVGLRLLIVLLAATALWPATLEPAYDRAIAGASLRVLHALERTPRIAGVRFEGHDAVIERTPGTELGEQRLELRTHHNNVPLVVALMLAASGDGWGLRMRRLLAALALLALTHVAHFVLAVHWQYAIANVGTYHVDDVGVLSEPLWQRLHNAAELRKTIVTRLYEFQAHVGRLVMPVLLWMLFAGVGTTKR